ncbi:ferritin family protein [bacterium]|nr:ferritin family protein [candidate division CSSED10-310 bacterium]
MALEKAIRTAIECEVKVRDVYRNAARTITDEQGRKVVERLAEEEQEHVDYLTARLKEWKQTGVVTHEPVPRMTPGPDIVSHTVAALVDHMQALPGRGVDQASDLQMLQRALEVERETSGFYQRMVDELPAEHQTMFRRFLEIERGHLAIVEAEIDSVRGMGFWFGLPEFDLENE